MSAPRPDPVTAGLQNVLDAVAPQTGGTLATYIPELAEADPDRFGIALVSMDGHVYRAGDSDVPFTIQSVSKPFVYALALGDIGADEILARVGAEPSGEAFNAISLEPDSGRPANPLINAGAMLTTSLVRGADPQERFERIRGCLSAFAGPELDGGRGRLPLRARDGEPQPRARVPHGERGLARRRRRADRRDLLPPVLGVGDRRRPRRDGRDARRAAGVNPVTGARVVDEDAAVRTLSVMATCGMYDYSGEWLLRVGLPAKSGVAGRADRREPRRVRDRRLQPAARRARQHGARRRGRAGDGAPLRPASHAPPGPDGARRLRHDRHRRGRRAADRRHRGAGRRGVRGGGAHRRRDARRGRRRRDAVLLDLHRVTRIQHIADRMLDVLLAGLIEDGIAVALVQQGEVAADVAAGAKLGTREEALAWCHAQGA